MARYAARLFILMLMLAMVIGSQVSMAHIVQAHGLAPHVGPLVACQGSDCTGDDPVLDGCVNYQTVLTSKPIYDRYTNYIGSVYLFYSGRCNARWADTTASDGGARVSASIYGTTGANYSAISIGYVRTLMVGAQAAYACGTVSGYRACTSEK